MEMSFEPPPRKKIRLSTYSVTYTPKKLMSFEFKHKYKDSGKKKMEIPHFVSTPIKNYFTQFNQTPNSKVDITPILKNKNIEIEFDNIYHPLPEMISDRRDLNVFGANYFEKQNKNYFDDNPFQDPILQSRMLVDSTKIMFDLNDKQNQMNHQSKTKSTIDTIIDDIGDTAVTRILNSNIPDCQLGSSDEERAGQFLQYLSRSDDPTNTTNHRSKMKSKKKKNSFNDLQNAMRFLGGVLEYITQDIIERSGFLAKQDYSISQKYEHSSQIKQFMRKNRKKITKYDLDVYNHDIDKSMFIIRPIHIQDAVRNDNQLFWLQQAVQIGSDDECEVKSQNIKNGKSRKSMASLSSDCLYMICSFFRGDLAMLSSLSRVNAHFYTTSGRIDLWKPIAMRCFLWNQSKNIAKLNKIIKSDKDQDWRCYISNSELNKLIIGRERWIEQNLHFTANATNRQIFSSKKFRLFSRINPVYNLHNFLYPIRFESGHNNNINNLCPTYLNDELYNDVFSRLLLTFGAGSNNGGVLNISKMLSKGIRLLTYDESKKELLDLFEFSDVSISGIEQKNELLSATEMENDDSLIENEILLIEIALNMNSILPNRSMNANNRSFLWIGRNIVIFAEKL